MQYLLALTFLSTVFADCVVDIRKLNNIEPSFFDPENEKSLWIPKNYQLKWKEGQSSVISCSSPTKVAQLKISEKEYNNAATTITCVSGDQFRTGLTGTKIVKSMEFSCKEGNFGNIRKLSEKCGEHNAGKILEIGFANGQHFSPIIRSCFNDAVSSVLFTSHYIYGDSLSSENKNKRPRFRQTGTPIKLDMYSEAHQKKMFSSLLGKTLGPKYFEPTGKYKTGNFLAKGHLAPNGDGIFNSWRSATFSLANTIPQWQFNNGGNWKQLEAKIRELAKERKEIFQVITGARETSKLPDEKNKLVDMYLGKKPGQLVIPKWMWKIVQSTKSKDAIMFIMLNEVYLTGKPEIKPPCQDVCKSSNWVNYKKDFTLGIIFCCNINNVNWVSDVLPSFKHSGRVLEFKMKAPGA